MAALLLALAIGAVAAMVLVYAYLVPLPDVRAPLKRPAMVLMTSDGEPFGRIGLYKEAPVTPQALPQPLTDAVIAIEDRNFYHHFGIDLRGTARAALANMKAHRVVEGGSTITQQLAKTTTGDTQRTLWRKAKEAVVALALELRLSKAEILSRYLSSAYFGDGVYGVRAASRHYFSKEPEQLSLSEAAMLAGVVNAPSRLAPTHHLQAARERERLVLAAMVESGQITQAVADKTPLASAKPGRKTLALGASFADWIEARKIAPPVRPTYGEVAIPTTLDARLQRRAEQIIARELAARGKAAHVGQAALVAMRPDGAVVAMVGGRDHAKSSFNRAVQAQRQPGSAFKVFVYLAALRSGASPDSLVDDAPIRIGNWAPQNADGVYRGPITLEQAFALSSNVAAVQVSEKVGRERVIRAARDLGIASPLQDTPSLALGTNPVNLLELTGAYTAVQAGRYPVVPYGIEGERPAVEQRSLPERDDLMRMMGSAVTYGTARRAALWEPAYGKTGTTQDNRDAWFIGFAQDLIVGVWVGNDDNSPMKGVSGGGLPADIWRQFVLAAQPAPPQWALPQEPFERPFGPERGGFWERLGRFFGF
jgi:penicillin-binding protein 1A